MTAREQAQEACYQRRLQVSQGAKLTTAPEDYADLASDVWEPLLREAWETIHHERCSTLLHTPDEGLHAKQCWGLGVALGEFVAEPAEPAGLVKDS